MSRGVWAVPGVLCVISACSSAPPTEPDPHHFETANGQLTVALQTTPDPPIRGTNEIELTITDPAGMPEDGLDLAVTPFMPSMGHGSGDVTQVTAEGNGVYRVTNVVFPMAGFWELRTTFRGKVTDSAAPSFQIP